MLKFRLLSMDDAKVLIDVMAATELH